MDDLINIIGNIGFPIGISIYLLVRIEEKIDSLTNSILELSKVIHLSISK